MHYRETSLWNRAMEMAVEAYRLVPRLPREQVYGLRSQLTRAMVSVPANVAEGWTRESVREKSQFFAITQGSLAETETLLTLCERLRWFPEAETTRLRALVYEVSRMLTSLRRKNRKETANR